MNQKILARTSLVALAILALAGCDSVKSALGLDRHVPDESQVVARPTLTLPPDYNLRPPGTSTPVSAEHETRLSSASGTGAAQSSAPKKEERGFFGRMFGGIFGDDEDTGSAKAAETSAQ